VVKPYIVVSRQCLSMLRRLENRILIRNGGTWCETDAHWIRPTKHWSETSVSLSMHCHSKQKPRPIGDLSRPQKFFITATFPAIFLASFPVTFIAFPHRSCCCWCFCCRDCAYFCWCPCFSWHISGKWP
jgi:hypothetical protein